MILRRTLPPEPEESKEPEVSKEPEPVPKPTTQKRVILRRTLPPAPELQESKEPIVNANANVKEEPEAKNETILSRIQKLIS